MFIPQKKKKKKLTTLISILKKVPYNSSLSLIYRSRIYEYAHFIHFKFKLLDRAAHKISGARQPGAQMQAIIMSNLSTKCFCFHENIYQYLLKQQKYALLVISLPKMQHVS